MILHRNMLNLGVEGISYMVHTNKEVTEIMDEFNVCDGNSCKPGEFIRLGAAPRPAVQAANTASQAGHLHVSG